ncbi:MAG: hypothetical protein JKY46_09495 [Robiginitomaculum sp.]|nr:hypothetical protein [Robiginitomaculum sp.]
MNTYAKTRYAIVLAMSLLLGSCSSFSSSASGDAHINCTPWISVYYDKPREEQMKDTKLLRCFTPRTDKTVIFFDDGNNIYQFVDVIRLGARFYAQYLEKEKRRYFLVWAGYGSADSYGNYFDYVLYELNPPRKLSEGVAVRPISVSEILKNNGGAPSPN